MKRGGKKFTVKDYADNMTKGGMDYGNPWDMPCDCPRCEAARRGERGGNDVGKKKKIEPIVDYKVLNEALTTKWGPLDRSDVDRVDRWSLTPGKWKLEGGKAVGMCRELFWCQFPSLVADEATELPAGYPAGYKGDHADLLEIIPLDKLGEGILFTVEDMAEKAGENYYRKYLHLLVAGDTTAYQRITLKNIGSDEVWTVDEFRVGGEFPKRIDNMIEVCIKLRENGKFSEDTFLKTVKQYLKAYTYGGISIQKSDLTKSEVRDLSDALLEYAPEAYKYRVEGVLHVHTVPPEVFEAQKKACKVGWWPLVPAFSYKGGTSYTPDMRGACAAGQVPAQWDNENKIKRDVYEKYTHDYGVLHFRHKGFAPHGMTGSSNHTTMYKVPKAVWDVWVDVLEGMAQVQAPAPGKVQSAFLMDASDRLPVMMVDGNGRHFYLLVRAPGSKGIKFMEPVYLGSAPHEGELDGDLAGRLMDPIPQEQVQVGVEV